MPQNTDAQCLGELPVPTTLSSICKPCHCSPARRCLPTGAGVPELVLDAAGASPLPLPGHDGCAALCGRCAGRFRHARPVVAFRGVSGLRLGSREWPESSAGHSMKQSPFIIEICGGIHGVEMTRRPLYSQSDPPTHLASMIRLPTGDEAARALASKRWTGVNSGSEYASPVRLGHTASCQKLWSAADGSLAAGSFPHETSCPCEKVHSLPAQRHRLH